MDSEVRTTTEDDEAEVPLRRTSTRSRKDPEKAKFLHGVRDIFIYIVFLVLYTIVIQSTALPSAYPYSQKLRARVLGGDGGLGDVLTRDGIWEYLENHLIDVVYGEIDTPQEGDDDAAAAEVASNETSTDDTAPAGRWGYILDVNRLIGAVELKQRRVLPTCEVPPVYETSIDSCYPDLATGTSDDQPYGGPNGTAFTSEKDGLLDQGSVFRVTLPINLTMAAARARVVALEDAQWIDLRTREVAVHLTVYNPAIDLFCNVEILMSPKASGGVVVSSRFLTVNLVRHMLLLTSARDLFPARPLDYAYFAIEVIFYTLAFGMWIQTIMRMCALGPYRCAEGRVSNTRGRGVQPSHTSLTPLCLPLHRYFTSAWNVLDLVNLSMLLVVIALRVWILYLLNILNFNPPPNEYAEFHSTAVSIYTIQV